MRIILSFNDFLDKYGLTSLDTQQKEAVRTTDGPVLLLAVPGSGKTTTLVARLGYLIYGKDIKPESILTMTYTVAATKEMKQRFAKKFGEEYSDSLEFRTINGVCARIIGLYAKQGHTAPKLAEDNETGTILRQAWLTAYEKYPTESDIKVFRTAITNVKNRMLTEEELANLTISTDDGEIDVEKGYKKYCRLMRENNLMDYDDQLRYAYAILKRQPSILSIVQNRYHYICVDETQDTSKIQHKIIQLMAQRSRNLFMVGDEDQSIYGFRAACPQELMDFEKTWPGAKVLYIENNYRSTPEIVYAAGDFIRRNKSRRNKQMHAIRENGKPIEKVTCKDRIEQYELIVDIAAKSSQNGDKTSAVLYRNNDTALPLIDMLSKRGIPYSCAGTDSVFFTSRIVEDIHNILKVALNPTDGEAFLQIYYKIKLYLKKDTAKKAADSGESVWNVIIDEADEYYKKEKLKESKYNFGRLKRCSAEEAIDIIKYDLQYEEYLKKNKIDPFRLDILEVLAKGQKNLSALFEHLDVLKGAVAEGRTDTSANFILSTIHSSKGLEYDRVFLADVADGIFPSSQMYDKGNEELEEERRLFYVGLTRAKSELVLFELQNAPSLFIRQVQDIHEKEEKEKKKSTVKTQRNGRKRTSSIQQTTLFQTQPATSKKSVHAGEYPVGSTVEHRFFGKGTVLANDGVYLKVDFPKIRSEKQIQIDAALSVAVLKKV